MALVFAFPSASLLSLEGIGSETSVKFESFFSPPFFGPSELELLSDDDDDEDELDFFLLLWCFLW
jgi:hypothetical protein